MSSLQEIFSPDGPLAKSIGGYRVRDQQVDMAERIAAAIRQPGGAEAVQLKVAEKAVEAYGKVAQDATTTLIVPSNMSEVSALIGSAMKMVQTQKTS